VKFREEINEMETKRTRQRVNEMKRWFFGKVSKIDTSLAKLTKRKREKTQINKIRARKRDNTTNINEI
jgi:hemerythrin